MDKAGGVAGEGSSDVLRRPCPLTALEKQKLVSMKCLNGQLSAISDQLYNISRMLLRHVVLNL